MQELSWILVAFFLPLFPMSMVFNALFQRARTGLLRVPILLAWPLPGILMLQNITSPIPEWVVYWALFTALLYGFRAVVIKEFGMWIGFLATSTWALTWIALTFGVALDQLVLHALAFSFPLAILSILVAQLEHRYESAYTGVISGLAHAQPRLSGLFVVVMLAVIGSPIFPAFFSMLDTIIHSMIALPLIAVGVVTVWLLWSWSGIRLLQDLLVGPATPVSHEDVSYGVAVTYGSSLVILIIGGFYISGVLL